MTKPRRRRFSFSIDASRTSGSTGSEASSLIADFLIDNIKRSWSELSRTQHLNIITKLLASPKPVKFDATPTHEPESDTWHQHRFRGNLPDELSDKKALCWFLDELVADVSDKNLPLSFEFSVKQKAVRNHFPYLAVGHTASLDSRYVCAGFSVDQSALKTISKVRLREHRGSGRFARACVSASRRCTINRSTTLTSIAFLSCK